MDFKIPETASQQAFRISIRTWLNEQRPSNLDIPADGTPLKDSEQSILNTFRRKLGDKGWLAPSFSKAFGGGGLSIPLGMIVQEELQLLNLPYMGDNHAWIPAMMVWGTETQQLRYVLPALQGKTITWQAFNEPKVGSDIGSIQTTATKDKTDYIINGEKAFITGRFKPDYLWTLAVTDETRPKRMNLGLFMIDATLPGISITTQRLLTGSERAPFQGWEIAQNILEGERGGYAFRPDDNGVIESIQEFLKGER